MARPQRLEALEGALRPVVEGFGIELDSVVTLKESGMTILRVTVESTSADEGVDSEKLADVSRAVSPIIDELDPIESEYFLEVSTPGAQRELTELRHWQKQVGKLARVKMLDGTVVDGKVMCVEDDAVVLEVDGTPTNIEFAQMKKARARVEFGSEE